MRISVVANHCLNGAAEECITKLVPTTWFIIKVQVKSIGNKQDRYKGVHKLVPIENH